MQEADPGGQAGRWRCGQNPSCPPRGWRDLDPAPSETTSAQTPSSLRYSSPPPHTSFLFSTTSSLGLRGVDGHSLSSLLKLRLQLPPLAAPICAAHPSPTRGPDAILHEACPMAASGPGIQNSLVIRAPCGVVRGFPGHKNTPDRRHPHPVSGSLCLRQHFRSPDRKWAGGSASRHLKATSCFPVACASLGVVPLNSTPRAFPGLHPSSSEGTGWWTSSPN